MKNYLETISCKGRCITLNAGFHTLNYKVKLNLRLS